MRTSFSSFKEASNFATKHASEYGKTAKIKREGNDWFVIIDGDQSVIDSSDHCNFCAGTESEEDKLFSKILK